MESPKCAVCGAPYATDEPHHCTGSIPPGIGCAHEFIFLRQERKNIGYDRNPKWLVEDVFFCNHCLTYRRVAVEERAPRSDSFTEEHVKRLV